MDRNLSSKAQRDGARLYQARQNAMGLCYWGCKQPIYLGGLCEAHYRRKRAAARRRYHAAKAGV